jgi:hypothetical protein
MTEPRYYEGIDSLLEFPSVQMADAQLRQSKEWEVVKIEKLTNDEVDHQGVVKRSEKLVFILGHRRASGNPATPTATAQQPPKQQSSKSGVSINDILNLPWEDSDYPQVDKWVPADKVPAAIAEHFRKTGERTTKGSYKLSAGNYEVYLSPKGHLQRYLQK